MARTPKNPLDIEEFPAAQGSGFASNPMPAPEVVAQMAAVVQQAEPEELLPQVHDPLHVALTGGYSRSNEGKSLKQLVDEFMAMVASHPDGNLLGCVLGGTPNDQQRFKDTDLRNQHRVEIRLVYREATSPAVAAATEAAKPAWKWQALVEGAKQPLAGRAAEQVTPPRQPWAYDHLVKPKEAVAV